MRFARFVVTGGVCALLSNVAVIELVRYGFGSLTALILAFGPVLFVGYALHSIFTFGTQPSRVSFGRYTLAMLTNFPLWAAVLYLLCDVLKVSVAIAMPATTALVFLWNYASARWALLSASGNPPWDASRKE